MNFRMLIAAMLAGIFASAPVLAAEPAKTGAPEAAEDDGPRPFDETRDAMSDVDAALARANTEDKNVLLVLGANWCHDSRGFAKKLADPQIEPIVEANYVVAFVDVGHRDRNLDVAKRFGVADLIGTPTLLILSGEGALLNADSVHDWRDAASRTIKETADYLERWAKR